MMFKHRDAGYDGDDGYSTQVIHCMNVLPAKHSCIFITKTPL